jgi:hypothetical protein
MRQIHDVASVDPTAFLGSAAGRKVLDAIQDPLARAQASFNLITFPGNAGKLPEARAIFEAMDAFGDSEAVRVVRAIAATLLEQSEVFSIGPC